MKNLKMLPRKKHIQLIIGIIILIVAIKHLLNLFKPFSIFNFGIGLLFLIVGLSMVLDLFKNTKIGNWLLKLLNFGATNKNEISKKIAVSFLARINLRRRIYELSIILYILAVIENLTSISIIRLDFWINYRTVSLEVMFTFIAIDSYIDTFNIRRGGKI